MLTQAQKERFKQMKEMSDNLSRILADLINDECTQAEAAEKLKISPMDFSRNVSNNFVYYFRKPRLLSQATADQIQMLLESPYDKLFRDIFHITDNPGYLIDFDTSEKLCNVMHQALNEREIRILTYRYGLPVDGIESKPHKFCEIAEMEQVSSEYIRKIHTGCIAKLRSPQYSKQLLVHSDKYVKSLQESETMVAENNKLDDQIVSLIHNNAILREQLPTKEQLASLLEDDKTDMKTAMQTILSKIYGMTPKSPYLPDETSVKDLELSNRITNVLLRNGINTLGELKKQSRKDLKRMQALGTKSIEELTFKLYSEYGIILSEK